MMMYLELLQKRYSVKKFDQSKIVQPEVLDRILLAGRLSASSLGLQPYKIYVVGSALMKEKLTPAFYNPSQIKTCSHLLVLVAKKKIESHYLDKYFRHITEVRQVNLSSLSGFRTSVDGFVADMDDQKVLSWAEKQAYIALGNLMFAAALEQVDTCPMEGFDQEKMEEILNLNIEEEKVSVTLALGFRAADDHFQNMKKVRKPDDKLFKLL